MKNVENVVVSILCVLAITISCVAFTQAKKSNTKPVDNSTVLAKCPFEVDYFTIVTDITEYAFGIDEIETVHWRFDEQHVVTYSANGGIQIFEIKQAQVAYNGVHQFICFNPEDEKETIRNK